MRLSMARWMAAGFSQREVARMHGVSQQRFNVIAQDATFKALVAELTSTYNTELSEMLLIGQRKAAATLVDLLESPEHEIRLKAAMRLLDQAGQPGPVIKKSEQSVKGTMTQISGDVTQALKQALMEPAIRELLAKAGGRLALPGGEVIEAEIITDGLPVPDAGEQDA